MVAANKLNFINQRYEPHHEKEHVKTSDAAKFQSCRPNTREMWDIWTENPKIRDNCMVFSLPMPALPYICLLFSGFSNV